MKVILLVDVAALGRKDEVKEVSGGYARNFLLPRLLAVAASSAALKNLAEQGVRREKEKSDAEGRNRASAEALKKIVLRFSIKTGGKGKTFGSINAAKIIDALSRQGIAVEKSWIVLDEPIKTTGEKSVALHLPHGVKAELKIIIEAE